jgi:hypothetical protein
MDGADALWCVTIATPVEPGPGGATQRTGSSDNRDFKIGKP